MKLTLSSIDYRNEDYKPVIYLFCRDVFGNRVKIPRRNFRPYFYIDDKWKATFEEGIYKHNAEQTDWTKKIRFEIEDSDLKVFPGDYVVKIYTQFPWQVGTIRRIFKHKLPMYEADILFGLRYLIDSGIKNGMEYDPISDTIVPIDLPSNLFPIFLDIEVNAPVIPEESKGLYEVVVVGFYDSRSKKYTLIVKSPKTKLNFKLSKFLHSEPKDIEIIWCEFEDELFKKIVEYLREVDPDVVVTFTPFDLRYLIGRMNKLKLSTNDLSPLDYAALRQGEARVAGLQIFDIADGYSTCVGESKWNTLEDIANKELGYGRIFHDESVHENWESDNWWKVLVRNLVDVELIKELNEQCAILPYFEEIKVAGGVNLSDTFFTSRVDDILFLRHNYGKVVLPIRLVKPKRDYQGPYVFPTTPGIYSNMAVLDWHQMFPSIIRTFNMSFDTYSAEGDLSIDDKWRFHSEPKGWTSCILDDLQPLLTKNKLKQKGAIKNKDWKLRKILDSKMWGLKSIVHGTYGLYGFAGNWKKKLPAARLYQPDIAEAIAYVSREVQLKVPPLLEEEGYELKGGDTDSLFIPLKTNNIEEEAEELQKKLSKKIQDYIQERWKVKGTELSLSVDKIFRKVILLTKKRYTGYTVEGEKIVKGIEIVRRNTPELTIEVQHKVVDLICDDKEDEVKDYLIEIVNNYREKKYPLTKIALPVKLSKAWNTYLTCTPELKAFLYSNRNLGLELKEGERFYLTYIHTKYIPKEHSPFVTWKSPKTKKTKRYKVKCVGFRNPKEIKGFKVDYVTMEDKILRMKLEDFIALLGLSWKDIAKDLSTKTLDLYFR